MKINEIRNNWENYTHNRSFHTYSTNEEIQYTTQDFKTNFIKVILDDRSVSPKVASSSLKHWFGSGDSLVELLINQEDTKAEADKAWISSVKEDYAKTTENDS